MGCCELISDWTLTINSLPILAILPLCLSQDPQQIPVSALLAWQPATAASTTAGAGAGSSTSAGSSSSSNTPGAGGSGSNGAGGSGDSSSSGQDGAAGGSGGGNKGVLAALSGLRPPPLRSRLVVTTEMTPAQQMVLK